MSICKIKTFRSKSADSKSKLSNSFLTAAFNLTLPQKRAEDYDLVSYSFAPSSKRLAFILIAWVLYYKLVCGFIGLSVVRVAICNLVGFFKHQF